MGMHQAVVMEDRQPNAQVIQIPFIENCLVSFINAFLLDTDSY